MWLPLLLCSLACEDSPTTDTPEETALPEAERPDPWCASPADVVAYQDVGPGWGVGELPLDPEVPRVHHPVGLVDFDRDGLDDLVFTAREQGLWYQRNEGGAFGEPELLSDKRDLASLAVADIDGDGDLDLWTAGEGPEQIVLENDGSGGFTDVSASSGLMDFDVLGDKRDGAFGDYDGDGDPDLYLSVVGRTVDDEPWLHQLYENDGAGHFTRRSDWIPAASRLGIGWATIFSDLDLDGDLDLYTVHADQGSAEPSVLLRNDGPSDDGHVFTDVSDSCTCTSTNNPMGGSPGDYNRDGLPDLFLTNTTTNTVLQNLGGLSFVDVSATIPDLYIGIEGGMTYGSAFFDFDNDGWLDVFAAAGPLGNTMDGLGEQADMLFKGREDGFDNVAADYGLADLSWGRGVAIGMLDDDGTLEIAVNTINGPLRIWRSECTANRALVVELEGAGANTFGVGARVEVETSRATFTQEVGTKTGWGGAQQPRAVFGLGSEGAIDGEVRVLGLRVYWPDGSEQDVEVSPWVDGRMTVAQ